MYEEIIQKAKEKIEEVINFFTAHEQQDIIVFSSLRWDFVFERPHHIVSKLAKYNKILFIEEPIPFHPAERGKTSLFFPQKNITVLQPKITPEHIKQELPLLIAKQIRLQKMHTPVLWFYSAEYSDIVPMLNHSLIIYDYMSKYPTKYSVSEEYLFSTADIVFTSERKFFENERMDIHNLYYLSPSVVHLDRTVLQIQKVMKRLLDIKKLKELRTQPFYHPLVPKLTVGK